QRFPVLLPICVFWAASVTAQADDFLEAGFESPPASARPQTWWHWMNGNITKVGIAADLKAMKQIGLGGATIVNVDCGIPRGPVEFMSPEWQDDFKFAVQEANRLGLKLCVENCAGWSSSGGPWNTVTNAMQRVTTSEVRLTGPTNFDGVLPQPPTKLGFYRDIAVLAFPATDNSPVITNLDAKDGLNGRAVLSAANASSSPAGAVSQRDIVDLSSKLTRAGRLNWHVPAGNWVILRIGYTPTGVNNHPAAWGGLGLECDKLSKTALDQHWDGFMQKVLDDVGPLAGRTLDASLIDSYEVGGQNWTKDFRAEFRKRRGYDPEKFLPVFAGQVVDSPAVTERFLWDVRRTIADLFAENYYGHFAQLCHRHGLTAAVEPYTGPFESLQCGRAADLVMGEFWSGSQGHPSVKLAASVAHIYGKQIVGAESFTAAPGPQTGRWLETPYKLKALGDLEFCAGLNRYIFHRYAMQPWTNRWPGMTMGQWGFHFERTETWWNQGKAWIDYISRCQFLLQQGRYVADAAYFDGQSAPVEMRAGHPPLPPGYEWDAIDADVLMHHATVKNHRLHLDSGASYAVLILPPDDPNMTPPLLRRIREFVRDGLTVVGPPPQHSPSLQDYPRCDRQVKSLAEKLWGNCDGTNVTEHAYGKGRVVWGRSLTNVLAELDLPPDFEFQGNPHSKIVYCHRQTAETDIYFVSNQRHEFDAVECSFRITGKQPELWNPETGRIEPAPVWREENGRTVVPLSFGPADSIFVVFRQPAGSAAHFVAMTSVAWATPAAAAHTPRLEIQSARYETRDGAKGADVTTRVASLVENGALDIAVNNDTLGGDPFPKEPKQLRVKYVLDDQRGEKVVPENQTLILGNPNRMGSAPAFEIAADKNGRVFVQALKPGVMYLLDTAGTESKIEVPALPAPTEISGPWQLDFPPNWGAPPGITLDRLISWSDDTNPGVKYFSGTATYRKEIEIPAADFRPGREIWLDLGDVENFAEVSLNGQSFGVLWKPPFRLNITRAARPGKNSLQIKVTNLWPNRLIGDEQLPADCQWNGKALAAWPQWLLEGKPSPTGRFTFTTWHHWTKDDPLLESGLLGPVRLEVAGKIPVRPE
ncbi:MAG TPA: glycosyl hydrolase, partial [Verrucomicrobiae bacterium]|nr:glycosyl hydrolase [Verrucomicrobiae bacterium]